MRAHLRGYRAVCRGYDVCPRHAGGGRPGRQRVRGLPHHRNAGDRHAVGSRARWARRASTAPPATGPTTRTPPTWPRPSCPRPTPARRAIRKQVEQFRAGKHALAWAVMKAMPMLNHQPQMIVGPAGFTGCSGCHKIGEKSAAGDGLRLPVRDRRVVTRATRGTALRSAKRAIRGPARPATWASTTRTGRCGPPPSTARSGRSRAAPGRAPTCQTCHMDDGDHGVMTAWGFLALRLPEEDQEWMADRVVILEVAGCARRPGRGHGAAGGGQSRQAGPPDQGGVRRAAREDARRSARSVTRRDSSRSSSGPATRSSAKRIG